MKKDNFQRSTIREIHSMQELQLEKARLKLELLKTEGKIKANYRYILSAFSLRNIFSTVTTELIHPSSIATSAITLVKNWLSKRKKKRKEKKVELKAEDPKPIQISKSQI